MSDLKIRPIQLEDNKAIAKVIRDVLIEMGVPKVGTAYEDKSLDSMFETYKQPGMGYYVVEEGGRVLGGAGIAPLDGVESIRVCELQKMYFLQETRGKGIGFRMINRCLDYAKKEGYTKCYLETMPYMEAARKLYRKVGFKSLEEPIGNTGHYSCQEWMIKDL
ncbi:GNAT family N-acetyltransferase [Aquimarina sediminis]|uniref:GNAT family N-acetyltransferase n=1 Tax=Aquimarina sediminis TaxID=2070536 RepID=UPI000CA02851|nr:GNAT family N-acetyltransferase [Aquimarina sediminis]